MSRVKSVGYQASPSVPADRLALLNPHQDISPTCARSSPVLQNAVNPLGPEKGRDSQRQIYDQKKGSAGWSMAVLELCHGYSQYCTATDAAEHTAIEQVRRFPPPRHHVGHQAWLR